MTDRLMWIPDQGIQTSTPRPFIISPQTHAPFQFRGPVDHFDATRLQGHTYTRTPRPQTDSAAIVTETIQNPYSGNALTAVQIDKRDVRNNMVSPTENRDRYQFLEASGWFTTADVPAINEAAKLVSPPRPEMPRPLPLLDVPDPMNGYRIAGNDKVAAMLQGLAMNNQQQSHFAAGFDKRSKLLPVRSKMTDYEYNNYGFYEPPQNYVRGQPMIQNNLLNPTSNRTWEQQIAPPAPWEGQHRHKNVMPPYDVHGQGSLPVTTNPYQYYDQHGRQITGVPFDAAGLELDPQLQFLPENHPVKLRAKHDYAARVKHKVYPQTAAENARRTIVSDTIIWRDLPSVYGNA